MNLSPKVLEVPLCIPHHMQGPCIGTSRWPYFCFPQVLVLGIDQEVFNGAITFEVGLYVIPTADLLDAFAWTLGVGKTIYDSLF